MVKLLIVDDEEIEREGMQAILQKSFSKLVIKQAKNGGIAVQMAGEFKPDLILIDIKMPGMSGLEAFERIIVDHPSIKFIMVTAYDTFDYMRQAIQLGAKDYLLKPSKASDIVETVGKVLKQIVEEQKSFATNRLQQELLQRTMSIVESDVVTQLLFDHVHEVHIDMLVELLDIKSMDEMFVVNVLMPKGSETFYSDVKEKVRQTVSGWVGALHGNRLPIIVFRNPEKSFRSEAVYLAREILSIPNFDTKSNWFVGIGNVCGSLDRVRKSYQESLMATMDTTEPVKYHLYEDMRVIEGLCTGYSIKQLEKEISDQSRLGQWEKVRTHVMNLLQCCENEGISLLQAQQRVLEVLWIVSRVLRELGIETATPFYSFQTHNYRQLQYETDDLLDQMRQWYVKYYELLEADTIEQTKQYIIEHSHGEISLDALGKRVGLSPIYMSRMFKEKIGVNYIDFLTECRIEKAKQLMSSSNKSIKEISYEVGYHDPNYFSKVFKKLTNVSPKEFQKTMLGKKD